MAEVPVQPQIQQPVQQPSANQPTSPQQPNVKISYLGIYAFVGFLVIFGVGYVLDKNLRETSPSSLSMVNDIFVALFMAFVAISIYSGIKNMKTASKINSKRAYAIGIFSLLVVGGAILFTFYAFMLACC